MRLIVINWFKDELTPFIGKVVELLFRLLLLLLPLGVFLLVIQCREKASKVSNLSVFTNDESVWQHIFPGFALVAISPETTKKKISRIKQDIQYKIQENKYLLMFFFMMSVIALLLGIYG